MRSKAVRKHDTVFQLSLTELAFTIIFILLILAGFMLTKAEDEKNHIAGTLADYKSKAAKLAEESEAVEGVYSKIRAALVESGTQNPDDIISELRKNIGNEALNNRLRKEIEDLNEKLSSLETVRKAMRDASPENEKLAVEKAMEGFAKENKNLRGQLAFLQGKLSSSGGRDLPPCWAEEKTGKIQYLFHVEIHETGLKIRKSWPDERDGDARALPSVDSLLAEDIIPLNVFRERVKGVDSDSRAKGCRHYVVLSNHVKQLEVFNRGRFAVEEYFYKYEVR